jgi:hypothetical protein
VPITELPPTPIPHDCRTYEAEAKEGERRGLGHDNWTKIHKTLRTTPAMAAGLTQKVWDFSEIVTLMDEVAKPEPTE